MKIKQWSAFLPLLMIITFIGCDDNTGNIGLGVLPDGDKVTVHSKTYTATSRTIPADSVFSRTSKAYLGKFTDPDFGYYECDFITQFNCVDTFKFYYYDRIVPTDDVKKVTKIELSLSYKNYFGDPGNTSRLSVYQLNDKLEQEKERSRYTDFNVEEYYNPEDILAHKSYVVNAPDYTTDSYKEVVIPLSNELGDNFLALYAENPGYFRNTEAFLENVFNGVYVKTDIGDGTILYIDYIDISLYANVYAVDSLGRFPIPRKQEGYVGEDSIIYNAMIGIFASTYEIFQTNRIQNSEQLETKAAEKGHTYVKSPAGLFTEITLPYEEIHNDLVNDSINSVKLTLSSYAQKKEGLFTMNAPETFLLLRKDKMYSFFEENQVIDGLESFLAARSSQGKYAYTNLIYLIKHCINEKEEAKKEAGAAWNEEEWLKENPDWDKVVIIPVNTEQDSNSNYIKIEHNLSPEYVKLEGGADNTLDISVIYTRFHDK